MNTRILVIVLLAPLALGQSLSLGQDHPLYNQWRSKRVDVDRDALGKGFIASLALSGRPYGQLEKFTAHYAVWLTQNNPRMQPEVANIIARDFELAYQRYFGSQRNLDREKTVENIRQLIIVSQKAKSIPVMDLGKIVLDEYQRMDERSRADLSLHYFSKQMGELIPTSFGPSEHQVNRFRLLNDIQIAQKDERVGRVLDIYLADKLKNLSVTKDTLERWESVFDEGNLFKLTWKENFEGGIVTQGLLEDKLLKFADKKAIAEIEKEIRVEVDAKSKEFEALAGKFEALQLERMKKEALRTSIDARYGLRDATIDLFGTMLSSTDGRAAEVICAIAKVSLEFSRISEEVALELITPEDAQTYGITAVIRLVQRLFLGLRSPESILSEQLVNIGRAVEELHKDMRLQFGLVHHHLTLLERHLQGELEDIHSLVVNADHSLQDIKDRLTLLHTAIRTFANEERAFNVDEMVNLCLNVPPNSTIDFATFRTCMNRFYTCAQNSNDGISAGTGFESASVAQSSDEIFYATMADLKFDIIWKNIFVLTRSAERFNNPISSGSLINPVPWAVCAHHYLNGAYRYPELYVQYDLAGSRAAEIASYGRALRDALNNIGFVPPSVEPNTGKPNDKIVSQRLGNWIFFDRLLQGYESRVAYLPKAINQDRTVFEARELKGYNMLLDARQPPKYPLVLRQDEVEIDGKLQKVPVIDFCPPGFNDQPNSGSHPKWKSIEAPPLEKLGSIIPNVFRVANDLAKELDATSEGLKFCYYVNPDSKVINDRNLFVGHTFSLFVMFDSAPILMRNIHLSVTPRPVEGLSVSAMDDLFYSNWRRAKDTFLEDSYENKVVSDSRDGVRSPTDQYALWFWASHKNRLDDTGSISNDSVQEYWRTIKLRNEHIINLWEEERRLKEVQLAKAVIEAFRQKREIFEVSMIQRIRENVPPYADIFRQIDGAKLLIRAFMFLGYPDTLKKEYEKLEKIALVVAKLEKDKKPRTVRTADTLTEFHRELFDRNRMLNELNSWVDDKENKGKSLFTSRSVTTSKSDADLISAIDAQTYAKTFPPVESHLEKEIKSRTDKFRTQLRDFVSAQRFDVSSGPVERHPILDSTLDRLEIFQQAYRGAF